MCILRPIDRIWAVGEAFHRQEQAPGDGTTLLMWCWYLDAALPVWSCAHRLDAGRAVEGVLLVLLLVLPFVFCRLRYTPNRRETILHTYHSRHLGRKMLFIWAAMILIACVEAYLLLHFGIWKIGKVW